MSQSYHNTGDKYVLWDLVQSTTKVAAFLVALACGVILCGCERRSPPDANVQKKVNEVAPIAAKGNDVASTLPAVSPSSPNSQSSVTTATPSLPKAPSSDSNETLQSLLKTMPADAHPGETGWHDPVYMAAAQRWLKEGVIGKKVTILGTVSDWQVGPPSQTDEWTMVVYVVPTATEIGGRRVELGVIQPDGNQIDCLVTKTSLAADVQRYMSVRNGDQLQIVGEVTDGLCGGLQRTSLQILVELQISSLIHIPNDGPRDRPSNKQLESVELVLGERIREFQHLQERFDQEQASKQKPREHVPDLGPDLSTQTWEQYEQEKKKRMEKIQEQINGIGNVTAGMQSMAKEAAFLSFVPNTLARSGSWVEWPATVAESRVSSKADELGYYYASIRLNGQPLQGTGYKRESECTVFLDSWQGQSGAVHIRTRDQSTAELWRSLKKNDACILRGGIIGGKVHLGDVYLRVDADSLVIPP